MSAIAPLWGVKPTSCEQTEYDAIDPLRKLAALLNRPKRCFDLDQIHEPQWVIVLKIVVCFRGLPRLRAPDALSEEDIP